MKKLLFTVLALSTLACALTACGKKEETKAPEQAPTETSTTVAIEQTEATPPVEEEPVVQIANPVVEYETLEEAVAAAGHFSAVPNIYARYSQRASVISGTLVQLVLSDDQGEILTIREQAGTEEDISGNYNSYAYMGAFDLDGIIVSVKGDSEDSINVVLWNDGTYSHSIDYVNGVTMEEVQNAVGEIK